WRRAIHADLLDMLPETRAIGIDIIFTDPNAFHPDDDQRLAQAISRHKNVVLPLALSPTGTIHPLKLPETAASSTGYINTWPDADGSIRSLWLTRTDTSGVAQQHMAAAMLAIAPNSKEPAGTHTRKSAFTAFGNEGPMLIPYAGPPGHFPAVPYADVLSGNIDPSVFKDKFVLIGSWGTGLGDTFPTPLSHNTVP